MAGRRKQHVRIIHAADKTQHQPRLDNALRHFLRGKKLPDNHIFQVVFNNAAKTGNGHVVNCISFIAGRLGRNLITEDGF